MLYIEKKKCEMKKWRNTQDFQSLDSHHDATDSAGAVMPDKD